MLKASANLIGFHALMAPVRSVRAQNFAEISWREEWPIYVRIHSPVFADGEMGDCLKMSSLIAELKHECFDKTQKRYEWDNNAFINPWNSLIRQADVQLSELGAQWLDQKIENAINKVGSVPDTFLKTLYTPVF